MVEELSETISLQQNNNGNIKAEVRNGFNGSIRSRPPEDRARQQFVSQVPQDRQLLGATASSRVDCLPIRRSAFGIRRNFPGQRSMSSQSRRRGNHAAAIDKKPLSTYDIYFLALRLLSRHTITFLDHQFIDFDYRFTFLK